MPQKKRTLQKVSGVCSKICFVVAFFSSVYLIINLSEATEVFRASMGATAFFFFMVGIVTSAMASTDIPNLTPGHMEEEPKNID